MLVQPLKTLGPFLCASLALATLKSQPRAMAAENKSSNNGNNTKKRKQRFRPHNKPVKKGLYPLRPGVEGFFITCDGGRERQASHEAINLLDSFYEELVDGEGPGVNTGAPNKPVNKIIKFSDSDSSSSDDDSPPLKKQDSDHGEQEDEAEKKNQIDKNEEKDQADETEGKNQADEANERNQAQDTGEPAAKKQCLETEIKQGGKAEFRVAEAKSIDKLIEAELEELGDRNKRRFVSLDSGCNGCIFIQMHKRVQGPGPAEIVQHMMKSAASTRKHMSRFILRVLPAEVACYSSEEEITKGIQPLISHHFPAEAQNPQKFAVLYEARANTGIDRMKIINTVAKSVPAPHKVDLQNPDKTIIVQIAKTICLVGVVERYKELAKFNLRQLASPKP